MKAKVLVIIGLIILAGAVILTLRSRGTDSFVAQRAPATPAAVPGAETTAAVPRVPAHYEAPPSNLPPTLPPDQFTGPTRDAYQAAKEIPRTLSQLPCYCYCDRNLGHKSLHSCYVDLHAAGCAVCINEALMAYRLQKEGLSPKQIRDRIIAEFSKSEM
jgi:Protein of unknown function with PCYCGC motif